jgi:hypothetical protein
LITFVEKKKPLEYQRLYVAGKAVTSNHLIRDLKAIFNFHIYYQAKMMPEEES